MITDTSATHRDVTPPAWPHLALPWTGARFGMRYLPSWHFRAGSRVPMAPPTGRLAGGIGSLPPGAADRGEETREGL